MSDNHGDHILSRYESKHAMVHHAPLFFALCTTSLTSPTKPPTSFRASPQSDCYHHLIGWMSSILFRENDRNGYHTMVVQTLCFRWFTFPRTPDEMRAIVNVPMACSCRESSPPTYLDHLHSKGVIEVQEHPYHNTPGRYLLGCCAKLMEEIDEAHETQLSRIEDRPNWPFSLEELFPYGAETTARTLFAWCRVNVDTQFKNDYLAGVDRWSTLAWPMIKPYIITSRTFACGLSELALSISASYRQKLKDHQQLTSKQTMHIFSWLVSISNILMRILTPSVEPHLRTFISHCPKELLTCCDRSIECISLLLQADQPLDMSEEDWKTVFNACFMARYLFGRFGDTILRVLPDLGHQCNISQSSRNAFHESPGLGRAFASVATLQWLTLTHQIGYMTTSRFCQYSGCAKCVVDTSQDLRQCAHCRRVRYCSRACQKHAWAHDLIPHRNICDKLRVVCAELRIKTQTYRFLASDTPLPKQLESRVVQVNLDDVVKGISAWSEHEIIQPCYRSEEEWISETFESGAL